jgi:type VI protein secretion system component VasF
MSEKKNIDRLFQEKFKDFEVAPPDFVWGNIQSRLEEKKKRRVIPLWFRLSGVAAILVTGMFVLAPYLTGGEDSNNNPVVIEVKDTNPDGNQGNYPN